MVDTLEFNGRTVRVEANWNAYVAFLEAVGRDDMTGLAQLASLRPSDIAPLMAACINEGERLEGRESHVTALEIGEGRNVGANAKFIEIYTRQAAPKTAPDSKKE